MNICQSGMEIHQTLQSGQEADWRLHWRPKRQHTEKLGWQEMGCFIGLSLLGCR